MIFTISHVQYIMFNDYDSVTAICRTMWHVMMNVYLIFSVMPISLLLPQWQERFTTRTTRNLYSMGC